MYGPEEGMVVFMGVQSYIAGSKGRQDERGNMIGETPLFLDLLVGDEIGGWCC